MVFQGVSPCWRYKAPYVLKLNLKHAITLALHKGDRATVTPPILAIFGV
jgi:hypothetical protein